MYIDAATQVSSLQTVTGTNTSVLSANTIDLLQNRDMGGRQFDMIFQVGTAFAGLTSLEMQVVTADDSALSTNLQVVGTTGPVPLASLTAGARFNAAINYRPGVKGQRYLGARYVITGASTAGTISTVMGGDLQDGGKIYPTSFSVS